MAAAAGDAVELPEWNKDVFVDACYDGDLALVRWLTSPEHMADRTGVNLNWIRYGATGFYFACRKGHIGVVQYLTSPAVLAAGIDVNKKCGGNTPLAEASLWGRVEVVRHLLESLSLAAAGIPVDVNAADAEGLTALHEACSGLAPPEVVALLLQQPQLDLDARDRHGKTAMEVAQANTRLRGHGPEKAALIRVPMRFPMTRRHVLVVAMWSRREGLAARAGAGVRAGAAPAVPAGTLDEEDEKARGRRRVMGGLPSFMLAELCLLAAK